MKPKNYEGSIRVRVEPELEAAIEQACAENGLSLSQYVRKTLREQLNVNAPVRL